MITTSGNTPVTNGIIMYTPSQYDRLLIVLIIFPISVVLLRLFLAIWNQDMAAVWSLFSVLGFICLVDLLCLPKGFDVRSNGEIGVITTLTILLHEGKNYVLESIRGIFIFSSP